MPKLKRTVLVTGASSGIGRAIARNLLLQGHHVVGVSRDRSKFAREWNGFTPLQMDLSRLPELPRQARELLRQHPEIDAVVFSAGIGQFGSLEEFSFAQIEHLMTVNFTSQVFLTRALIANLKARDYSDLIYIGSEAALKGSRKGTMYCASKFALRGFTQALREESANSGVRICLINPGMVKTEFFDRLHFEPGENETQYLLPDDIAEAVSYVLNSRNRMVIDEINLNPMNRVVKFKKSPG
ncbi:MAG: SDR family oxidoreductase [Gammaproteobacteria bacterium]